MTLVGSMDPAWASDAGGGGKGANAHYELRNVEEMAWDYRKSPPWNDTGPGLLFMWATTLAVCSGGRSAPHQLALALDFRICASWVWAKVDEVKCTHCIGGRIRCPNPAASIECGYCNGRGFIGFNEPARPSIGQYQSTSHEFLFLCRRGDFDLDQYESIRAVRDNSVIYAPRVTAPGSGMIVHSAKPPKAYEQTIEPVLKAAFPNVRPVEWNCRNRRRGWGAYGRLHGEYLPDGVTPAPLVYELGDDEMERQP